MFYQHTENELKMGEITNGVVIDLVVHGEGMHSPIVQYKNSANEVATFKSSISSKPPRYELGEEVEVLHFSDLNKKPKINSLFRIWAGALFFGGFSLFAFVMSGVIWAVRKNEKHT